MLSDGVGAVKAALRVGLRPILDAAHPARASPFRKAGKSTGSPEIDCVSKDDYR